MKLEQFRDDNAAADGATSGWVVYDDPTAGSSIRYPADGRVDVVKGVTTFTNRDLAGPA